MNFIKNTVNILICLVVLTTSIGIPVILNHIHNSEENICKIEEVKEDVCEEAKSCCEIEDSPISNEPTEPNCECNLLASCCCCFFEVELVTFSFDIPLNFPVSPPVFIEAYATDLFSSTILSNDLSSSLNRLESPPPLPYSQKLAFFQVFRI